MYKSKIYALLLLLLVSSFFLLLSSFGIHKEAHSQSPTEVIEYCSSPNLAIPDNDPSGATVAFNVIHDIPYQKIVTYLNVSHTYINDLIVHLTHDVPGGSTVALVEDFTCYSVDIDVTLDPDAPIIITDNTTCSWVPPGVFGTFAPNNAYPNTDSSMAGTWNLKFTDTYVGDTGTVNQACLRFTVNSQDLVDPPMADGTFTGLKYANTKVFHSPLGSVYPFRTVSDSSNNIFVVGEMSDYNWEPLAIDLDWNYGEDTQTGSYFLAKYSSNGTYLWGMTLSDDFLNPVGAGGLDVDSNGNVYLSGDYEGTVDFNFTGVGGPDFKTAVDRSDAFLMKINANGSYGWTKTWGGSQRDFAYNVSVDSTRNAVYVVGNVNATNINFNRDGGTPFTQTRSGMYISKFDLNGNHQWAYAYGTRGVSTNLVLDIEPSTGDIYLAGIFNTTIDFDPSGAVDNRTSSSSETSFLTRLTHNNNYIGTTVYTRGSIIDIYFDSSENLFLTGEFRSNLGAVEFNPGGTSDARTSVGNSFDIFISKRNADYSYAWTRTVGGTASDKGYSVASDSNGNVYVSGSYASNSVDFDFSSTSDIKAKPTDIVSMAFLMALTSDGDYANTQVWGGVVSGASVEAENVHIDSQDRIYVTGYYVEDTDFDPTANKYIYKGNSSLDWYPSGYISRFYPAIYSDLLRRSIPLLNGVTLSSSSTLTSLTTTEGALSPSFSPTIYNYSKDVDKTVRNIGIIPNSINPLSRLTINDYAVHLGGTSNLISLSPGSNQIDVETYSEDGVSSSVYTLNIEKPLPEGTRYVYDSHINIGTSTLSTNVDNGLVDSDKNIYVTGTFNNRVDLDPDPDNVIMSTRTNGRYLLKLSPNMEYLWHTEWINEFGVGSVNVYGIELDSNDNIYLVGFFENTVDFDPTEGVDQKTSSGQSSFLLKMNSNRTYGFVRTWAGTASEVAISSDDYIYVGGTFSTATNFGGGVITPTTPSGYIVKYNTLGVYQTVYTFFPSISLGIDHITLDNSDNIIASGNFSGTVDFNPGVGTNNVTSRVNFANMFIFKLNTNGDLSWVKTNYADDTIRADPAGDLVTDSLGNIYMSGEHRARNGDISYLNPDNPAEEYITDPTVSYDPFVVKFQPDGTVDGVFTIKGTGGYPHHMVSVVNDEDNYFIAGYFYDKADFDPTIGEDIVTSVGWGDGFISQMNKDSEYIGRYLFSSTDWSPIYDMATDSEGSLYLFGEFSSDMIVNPLLQTNIYPTGSTDVVIIKMAKFVPSNVNLSSLLISEGSLSPTFDPSVTSYTVDLDTNQSSITFTPTAEDSGVESIEVNGTPVNSGSATAPLSLNEGTNVFNIVVTGSDAITTKTYIITVNNPEPVASEGVSIKDVPLGLKIKDAITKADLTIPSEDNKGNDKRVRVYVEELFQDTLVAEVLIDIQEDLSWPDIKAGASRVEKKTYIQDLTDAEGTADTNKLYVPKDGHDNKVRLCLNSNLTAVERFCFPGIDLTIDDPNVDIVLDEGNEYWEIDNVEDVGGLSVYEPPVVPPSEEPVTPPPPESPTSPITEEEEEIEEPVEEVVDEEVEDDEVVPVVIPPTPPDTTTDDNEPSFIIRVIESIEKIVTNVISRLQGMDSTETQTVAVGSFAVVATGFLLNTLVGSTDTSLYSLQFISSFFFIKKLRRKGQNFGLVYDSVTKEPINRAIVRITDSNGSLVSSEVTDIYGIFDARLNTGSYKFSVEASEYSFPSRTITLKVDEPYMNVYHGEELLHNSSDILNISIPLDKVDSSLISESGASAKSIFMGFFNVSLYFLFVVGFITTVFTLVKESSVLGWITLLIYILFTIGYLIVRRNEGKKFGFVRNSSGSLIEGLELGLIELEFNQLSAKRVTDEDGKYRFIVPRGKYRLVVLSPGYELLECKNDIFEVKEGSVEVVKEDIIVSKK